MLRRSLVRLVPLAVALMSGAALACPVCGYATKEQEWSFLLATAFMTLTPLALVGGVVAYVVVQLKKHEAAQAAPDERR